MIPITIIDYGTSNLGSMRNMLKKLDVPSRLATSTEHILDAEKIIMPGVGSFDSGMRALRSNGMVEPLNYAVLERQIPFLGICLGMQMLGLRSEEGSEPGLGWIKAQAKRFDPVRFPGMRVPHMGWNEVKAKKPSMMIDGAIDNARFYFANSYHVDCEDKADVLLETEYAGFTFTSALEKGHIRGAQFHPEKSHRYGMWLLKNFAEKC